MNTKTAFVALVAVLAVFMFSLISAAPIDESNVIVNFNGVDINTASTPLTMAGFSGESVPVRITFQAQDDLQDVKVRVEVYGGSDEYSDSTERFNIVSGSVYTKLLNLQLPKKMNDQTNDIYLKVYIYNPGYDYEANYDLIMQRNSYQLQLVSVDYNPSVSAGDSVPVSVVVKNVGFQNSQDGFATITIPELGVYSKAYFGDLIAVDNCSDDCNKDDSAQAILYVRVPESAKDGVYNMVVKAYDGETTTTQNEVLKVSASSSTQVIPAASSQDIKAGETKTFDLILVNSANKIMVYNLNAVSGSDLKVSVPSVITVDPDSSKTVQVTVTASSDAKQGSYPFSVLVNGQSTTLSANVTGKSVSASAIALTAILVIVFVVLLVVLIVLLTRKDKPASEEVETSYY